MTRAQILQPTPASLAFLAEVLLQGSPVAMPTETVYGLAGSALDPLALARIFETKERPTFDPLIIHIGLGHQRVEDLARAGLVDPDRLSPAGREIANQLMAKFWPGPLTLVLPKDKSVPDLATSGLDTVAIRMPHHPVAQALIAACGIPLAAPSANRFGRISPTSAQDVVAELGERIDFILDGGSCEIGVESTILSVEEDGTLRLLRPGGLPIEEIEGLARVIQGPRGPGIQAPGMLENHYAPRTPFFLLPAPLCEIERLENLEFGKLERSGKIALLGMQGNEADACARFHALSGIFPAACRILSPSGDLGQSAHSLFATLRALDLSDVSVILSEPCQVQTGLGYAIGDRLRRAAAAKS